MFKKKNNRYVHDTVLHNTQSPEEIIPYILQIFEVKSVLDVGCGTGTWLKVFLEKGVKDVAGIDGHHIDKNNLVVSEQFILLKDLEQTFRLDRKFDLTISLEVAEHLAESSADDFVESLCATSDTIIFSAAVVYQGGQNHLNEQWQSYWIKKFNDRGYADVDLVRPKIWDNKSVFYWYKQNMICFIRKGSYHDSLIDENNRCLDLIHPEPFFKKADELERALRGKRGVLSSLGIFIRSFYAGILHKE